MSKLRPSVKALLTVDQLEMYVKHRDTVVWPNIILLFKVLCWLKTSTHVLQKRLCSHMRANKYYHPEIIRAHYQSGND